MAVSPSSRGLAQVVDYIRSLHFTDEDIAFLRAQGIFDENFLAYLKNFRFTAASMRCARAP